MIMCLLIIVLRNILYISVINNSGYLGIEITKSKNFFYNLDYIIKKLMFIGNINCKNLSYIIIFIEKSYCATYNFLATVINSLTYICKIPIITVICTDIGMLYKIKNSTKILNYYDEKNKYIKVYRFYQKKIKLLIKNRILGGIINQKISSKLIRKLLLKKNIKKNAFSRYISLYNY